MRSVSRHMNHKVAIQLIRDSSDCAQQLIDDLHDRDPRNDTFAQVGLLDGLQIISDFLSHNEMGLALEHLLYMIHESDIKFEQERVVRLHSLAAQLNIDNHYTRQNLEQLGVTNAYNVPPA